MNEFDIIDQFFRSSSTGRGVKVGPGDDCAVISPASDEDLLVTTDTLLEGTHFPPQSPPEKLAYRSCATALSDIAAMGGYARWASLALTMPSFDEDWLKRFVDGFHQALAIDDTALIGGDLTRGPLSITWHITGIINKGSACLRVGAKLDDDIYVTGQLGAAAYALTFLQTDMTHPSLERYWYPAPRLGLARELNGIITSCIDISDGLLADLGHILEANKCSAILDCAALPAHESLRDLQTGEQLKYLLGGGDDYELCFTADPGNASSIKTLSEQTKIAITPIGKIIQRDDSVLIASTDGQSLDAAGYQHF